MQNTGLPRRLAAMLYDTLLVTALLFLVTLPFVAVRGGEPVETGDNLLYRMVLVLAVYGFFVGFWSRAGRTLRMQSWGLQLVTEDGRVPSFGTASWRFFAALLSILPLGLGFLWQLWDAERLTWHDRLSKTLERVGVEPVTVAVGDAFDPEEHEAVLREHDPRFSGQVVTKVLQTGFRYHDRLLRPAKVVVNADPS